MWWLFAGAAGATGALYFLMNLVWPGWYLDYIEYRANLVRDRALMKILAKGQMLVDVFEEKAKLMPQKTFIIFKNEQYSYEYVDKRANQVARACVEIGAVPGCTIAVMIYNSPEFLWTHIGKIFN